MNVNEVTVGLRYRVSGDLSNGCHADGTPRISHDDVVRVIKRITDTHVILECGSESADCRTARHSNNRS